MKSHTKMKKKHAAEENINIKFENTQTNIPTYVMETLVNTQE
jgi:hypothetical protein